MTSVRGQAALFGLWGGVHFKAAITQGAPLGRRIGNLAHRFVQRHVDGSADHH